MVSGRTLCLLLALLTCLGQPLAWAVAECGAMAASAGAQFGHDQHHRAAGSEPLGPSLLTQSTASAMHHSAVGADTAAGCGAECDCTDHGCHPPLAMPASVSNVALTRSDVPIHAPSSATRHHVFLFYKPPIIT